MKKMFGRVAEATVSASEIKGKHLSTSPSTINVDVTCGDHRSSEILGE